jgi:hypothetical protein
VRVSLSSVSSPLLACSSNSISIEVLSR